VKTSLRHLVPQYFYALIFLCLIAQCSLKVAARERFGPGQAIGDASVCLDLPSVRDSDADCSFQFVASPQWIARNGCKPDIHLESCKPIVALTACSAGSEDVEIGTVTVFLDDVVLAVYRICVIDGAVIPILLEDY
jgi:hypothetical protein